jgi:hypothetical protein
MSSIEPGFETRLRTRLRDTLDAMDGPHPEWAASPAAHHLGLVGRARNRNRWPIRLLAVAAVLALAGGAITAIGSLPPRRGDESAKPVGIPLQLTGLFAAQRGMAGPGPGLSYYWFSLDFEDDVLLFGPNGSGQTDTLRNDAEAMAWAGRVTAVSEEQPGTWDVTIQAPPPCGSATYAFQSADWEVTLTARQDACADRTALLSGPWMHRGPTLVPGERYRSRGFSEPFEFALPATQQSHPEYVLAHWFATGRLGVYNNWSHALFFDDQPLPVDACDASRGSLSDLPGTPEGFEAWLRASGLTMEARAVVAVNGRTAIRYDTESADCPSSATRASEIPLGGRYYLVPSPNDTILVSVYGDTDAELRLLDELVRSITFD